MPSLLIHLKVAYVINKRYPVSNLPQFLLGSIAPDAINLHGFAPKELRWKVHMRSKDLDQWEQNSLAFYYGEKKEQENNYLLGYVVHLLTDITFDRKEEPIYQISTDHKKTKKQCQKRNRQYENSQLQEEWWKETKDKLKESTSYAINGLGKKNILEWREKILKEYEERTYEEMGELTDQDINEVTDKIISILQKQKMIP